MSATEFKTGDMTLVVVLKMKGIEPIRLEKEDRSCFWIFDLNSEATEVMDLTDGSGDSIVEGDLIADILARYEYGEITVEPKEFVKKLSVVRSKMYDFLGHTSQRVRA